MSQPIIDGDGSGLDPGTDTVRRKEYYTLQTDLNNTKATHPRRLMALRGQLCNMVGGVCAFYLRNLKPQRRRQSSMLPIARRMAAELYQRLGRHVLPIPT